MTCRLQVNEIWSDGWGPDTFIWRWNTPSPSNTSLYQWFHRALALSSTNDSVAPLLLLSSLPPYFWSTFKWRKCAVTSVQWIIWSTLCPVLDGVLLKPMEFLWTDLNWIWREGCLDGCKSPFYWKDDLRALLFSFISPTGSRLVVLRSVISLVICENVLQCH